MGVHISAKFLQVRSYNHFELLAFNAQKFKGLRDPGHATFSKKFQKDHVRIVAGNMHAKFEVRHFNRFKVV